MILTGFILITISMIQGESSSGVIIIFPFFYGSGILSFSGILCIILGFFMYTFSQFENLSRYDEYNKIGHKDIHYQTNIKKKIKGGGVVFIGPIPIIFGSDSKITIFIAIFALIIMIIAILFL